VGFIGRVEAAKGTDTLLDAVATLPPGAVHLRIAGDGDAQEMAALRERYRNDPYVEFLGPVRARDFYPDIDLLVVPSRAHESFCNVVVEAASLGIPAIVSDRGALPERLGDGRYGWCFPAGDVPALARLLADCAGAPERVLQTGRRAIETRAQHHFPTMIDHYLRTLQGWLDEHRGTACA
jgi:glycosyltransferase involved in cell wall biosynthesis